MIKKLIGYLLFWKTVVLGSALVGVYFLPLDARYTAVYDFGKSYPYLVWIWGNFDGIHYMDIARNGYHDFNYPFFPLYPLLLKAGDYFLWGNDPFGEYLLAGVIVSHICFFAALVVCWKLLEIDKLSRLRNIFFLSIILFPTSYAYGAVYNDSLFFLLAVLSIYFARTKAFWKAAVFGALATLTRLNGLPLFFLIYLEYVESLSTKSLWSIRNLWNGVVKSFRISNIVRNNIYFLFLIPGAFLSYLVYIHIRFGSWTLPFTSMKVWDQDKIILPIQVVWRYIKILLFSTPYSVTYFVALVELLSVFLYIFLLAFSFRRIRFSYWVFFLLSLLIPGITGTFQGMPRYGLHLYPFFLTLAYFLNRRSQPVQLLFAIIGIGLLFVCTILFTRGYFIA